MPTNLISSVLRIHLESVRRLALVCMVWGFRWLSRVAVALVFAIGVVPSGTGPRIAERESELSIQGAEDSEISRRPSVDAAPPRRVRAGAGAPTRDLEAPSAPLTLEPRRSEAPRQSWQHPRRSIPPDEEDDATALA